MKLDFNNYTSDEIQDQILSWLTQYQTFIRTMHRVVSSIGKRIEGNRTNCFESWSEDNKIRVLAIQEPEGWDVRRSKPIVRKSIGIYVNSCQVVYVYWQDDSGFDKNSFFRPGDWISAAQGIITKGLADEIEVNKQKDIEKKNALLRSLFADLDL